jgi:DDE family transposase
VKVDYFSKPFDKFWLLNTDISSLFRPYSPCLAQRRYVYKANNQVKGNRPVEVGYELSTVGLSCRRPLYGISEPAWNPPLSMRLVPFGENKNTFTAGQVNDLLLNKDLPFHSSLTVNALDSNYCSPEYVVDTYARANLVNIIRMPSNRNVWKRLSEEEVKKRRSENTDNRGANRVYGTEYKLKEADGWDLAADIRTSFGIRTSKGKTCIVQMDVWEDMLVRSKRGKSMKDKPFRLVRIQLLDAKTEQPLFKKCMWLCVWGERRMELNAEEIYWAYRNRYDIEHFFRFGKQRLLLDKSQTPDEGRLQNWMEIVNLAYWLLFVGKGEARHGCRKWQQYDKNFKNRVEHDMQVTPSQVQLQMEGIILGFEQDPFLPKLQIKGKGRKKGQLMQKRKRHPVLKKGRKKKKQQKK